MRICLQNNNYTAHYYINLGLARALTALGHECVLWDSNQKSAYDAFDEFEPHIFMGQTYNLDPNIVKCCIERPAMKLFMRAFDYSEFSNNVLCYYPIGYISAKECIYANELREAGLDLVLHNHYTQSSIEKTHANWINDGFNVKSSLLAADLFSFYNGKKRKEFESDICFIGGRWGYKALTLDKYLVSLCAPEYNYNIKIFGNQSWGIPQYCGPAPDGSEADLLASAKICPNLSEPHSQKYGYDIIERPFKILSNQCFCISDYVQDLVDLIPHGIVYAKSSDEFKTKVEYYLDHPEEREDIALVGFEEVYQNHTYFERAVEIFRYLDLHQAADNAELIKEDIKGSL